jgi:hypothetical protein
MIEHTINAGVVRLDEGLLDLAVLDQKGITLSSLVAEDSASVKVQIQSLGKLACWVGNEAELCGLVTYMCSIDEK